MKSTGLMCLSGLLLVCGMAAGNQDSGFSGRASHPLFYTFDRCVACHNGLAAPRGGDASIGTDWQPSMMANASRDPYWHAAVRREVLDHPAVAAEIEDECSVCHMPMARTEAKAAGQKFGIFAHLPAGPGNSRADLLAADGVSCTACHQIQDKGLGQKDSYTGGFVIDVQLPVGQRSIFGPYVVDKGRTRVMQSSSDFEPRQASHVTGSEFCATCHTLYTHALGPDGKILGQLPEQVPYLEWRHSGYSPYRSCQSCHMPVVDGEMAISSVLGQPRNRLARHVFRAGNFFMPRIFARYRDQLAVNAQLQGLDAASRRTVEHLETEAARLAILSAKVEANKLLTEISIENLAGHKLPSAYPSRRAWIHFTVRDRQGQVVFESGALQPDGSISGNDNDSDASLYEPHYEEIDNSGKVQVYESVMADADGRPTTGLLTGLRYIKDNRLLPMGFDKTTAAEDIATQGDAQGDGNFTSGGDRIRYSVDLRQAADPFTVQVEIWYQPIGYRWAQNLRRQRAEETDRFVSYYESMAGASAVILARTAINIPQRTNP